jgi:hypothetical protein
MGFYTAITARRKPRGFCFGKGDLRVEALAWGLMACWAVFAGLWAYTGWQGRKTSTGRFFVTIKDGGGCIQEGECMELATGQGMKIERLHRVELEGDRLYAVLTVKKL